MSPSATGIVLVDIFSLYAICTYRNCAMTVLRYNFEVVSVDFLSAEVLLIFGANINAACDL